MMKPVLLTIELLAIELLAIGALTTSAFAAPATPAMQAPATAARSFGTDPSPYTAATAKDFADTCKTDESSCAAMIGEVMMDRIQFTPTSHICVPGITYAGAVGPWLEAHPEAAKLSAADGIYLALTTIYKCGHANNP